MCIFLTQTHHFTSEALY